MGPTAVQGTRRGAGLEGVARDARMAATSGNEAGDVAQSRALAHATVSGAGSRGWDTKRGISDDFFFLPQGKTRV